MTFKAIPVLLFSTLYSYQISSWKYNLYELYTVIYSEDIEQKDYIMTSLISIIFLSRITMYMNSGKILEIIPHIFISKYIFGKIMKPEIIYKQSEITLYF